MFKCITPLGLAVPASLTADVLAAAAAAFPFTPCGATQPDSAGWVPPRGTPHAPLAEAIHGAWHLMYAHESKRVPGEAIKKRLDELCAQIEQERGYKPGRREQKELREQVVIELLPHAWAKRTFTRVVIFPRDGITLIDTASTGVADEVATALVRLPLAEGLVATPLQTQQSAAGVMAAWLAKGETGNGFYLDRECTLQSPDEMRSVVRYQRKALDTDEVKAHIAAGMRPKALALSLGERVAFTLTEGFTLKKLDMLDAALTGRADVAEDEAFDADAAIFAGESLPLIKTLIDAMGGLIDRPAAQEAA